jgi:hypothetical protein
VIGKIPALPRLRGARAGPPITGALLQQVLGLCGVLVQWTFTAIAWDDLFSSGSFDCVHCPAIASHSQCAGTPALRAKTMVYNFGIAGCVDWLNFVRGSFLSPSQFFSAAGLPRVKAGLCIGQSGESRFAAARISLVCLSLWHNRCSVGAFACLQACECETNIRSNAIEL